jgi:iron(III) transport system permease protein
VLGTLVTTCAISAATAIFSTISGAVMAWIVARTDFRHKRLVTTLTGLSFCFPGFILAMAWIIIGSPGGLINGLFGDALGWNWARLDIYSAVGIVWIQVLHITPFTYFSVRAPLSTMDAGLEEAAYMAGATPWQAAVKVTVPLMVYPLLSSLLLSFVLAVEQFAIPAMVGIPPHNVLATQLYLLTSCPQHGLAAAIGLALSALTASVVIHRRLVRRLRRHHHRQVLPAAELPPAAGAGPPISCASAFCSMHSCCRSRARHTSLIKFFVANPLAAPTRCGSSTFSIVPRPVGVHQHANRAGWRRRAGTDARHAHRYSPACARGHRLLDLLATLPSACRASSSARASCVVRLPADLRHAVGADLLLHLRFMPYATETVGAQITQIDKSPRRPPDGGRQPPAVVPARGAAAAAAVAAERLLPALHLLLPRDPAAVLLYTSKTALISISI